MNKKERQKWKTQMSNPTFMADLEKVRKMVYEMEIAITKTDQQNNQIRKKAISQEEQFNKRVQEVHDHYTKKKGVNQEQILQKQNETLSKKNSDLISQISLKQQQIIKLNNSIKTIVTSNESALLTLKTDYEKKLNQSLKQLTLMTSNFNKLKYENQKIVAENEKQKKVINEVHQRQLTKLNNTRNQLKKQRQQELRKQMTVFYQAQIQQIKDRHILDIDQIKQTLKSQYLSNLSKKEKEQQEKLSKQLKISQNLRAETLRLKKIHQNAVIQHTKRAQSMRSQYIKETKALTDKMKAQQKALIQQHTNQINETYKQLEQTSSKLNQLSIKHENLTKQFNKTTHQKVRLQKILEANKIQNQKRINNSLQNHQKTIEKVSTQSKIIIEKLQNDNATYIQLNKKQLNDINELQTIKSSHQSMITKLSQEKARLQKTIQNLKNQHQRKTGVSQALNQKAIQRLNNENKSSIQKLTNEHKIIVEKYKKQIENWEVTNNEKLSQINNLQQNIVKLQKNIKSLNQQILKRDRQIKKLNETIQKKQNQIKRLNQIKDNHLNKINDLHQTVGQMIPISQIDNLNLEHQKQIQKLQNQLWQIHERMGQMVPTSQLERVKEKTLDQKRKIGQDYQSVQHVLSQLKKRLEDTERNHKQSIVEIKHQHRIQISQILSQNQNKLLELKSVQADQNDRKNAKHITTIQQIKQQLKDDHNRQINRIRQENKKLLDDLNNEKKRQGNQLRNQIQNLKTKIAQSQKQLQLSKTSINQQKQDIYGKLKNDQITISNLKAKIDQYENRQKKSQLNIKQLQQSVKELQNFLLVKQKQYDQELRLLKEKMVQQNHQKQLLSLKKEKDINEIVQNSKKQYQTKLYQLQRKQANEKKHLNQRISQLEIKNSQKDKEMERLRKQQQQDISQILKNKQKKQEEQKIMQRKLQQQIQEIMIAKDKEHQFTIKTLKQQNNQYLQQIVALQSSNKMLRQQVSAGLARSNKEKQMYEEINRMKSQLSNAQRRTTANRQIQQTTPVARRYGRVNQYQSSNQSINFSSQTNIQQTGRKFKNANERIIKIQEGERINSERGEDIKSERQNPSNYLNTLHKRSNQKSSSIIGTKSDEFNVNSDQ